MMKVKVMETNEARITPPWKKMKVEAGNVEIIANTKKLEEVVPD